MALLGHPEKFTLNHNSYFSLLIHTDHVVSYHYNSTLISIKPHSENAFIILTDVQKFFYSYCQGKYNIEF